MSLEHERAVALYVLDRYRHPAARFVAPIPHGLFVAPGEKEWTRELESQIATEIAAPVAALFRRRVLEAESVDEVHQLMVLVTGVRDWEGVFGPEAVHAALANPANPAAELCRLRLRPEFASMQ